MGYIPLVQRVKFPACSGRSITHSDRASFLMPFCDDDSHLICLVFLSRNRFYIFSLKAHVIFPTPASNSDERSALVRNVEFLLILFRQLQPYQRKLVIIGTTYTGTDSSR
jgi:hypothetical protein